MITRSFGIAAYRINPAEALRQRPRTARRHRPGGHAALPMRPNSPHTHEPDLRRYSDDAADRLRVPTEVPGRAVSPGKRGQMGATSGFRALSWAF